MKKSVLRFCAGLLAVILLSVTVVPCYAVTDEYTSTGTFWSSLKEKWWLGFGSKFLIGQLADSACSESPDSRHHGSLKTYAQNSDGSYTAICSYCSAEFPVYDADLSAAYDDYVATLPASGYNSSGKLTWRPTFSNISNIRFWGRVASYGSGTYYDLSSDEHILNSSIYGISNGFVVGFVPSDNFPSFGSSSIYFDVSGFPVVGSYFIAEECKNHIRVLKRDQSYYEADGKDSFSSFRVNSLDFKRSFGPWVSYSSGYYVTYTTFFPLFEIVPDVAVPADTYNINSRPTSITGGNYGIVGDNGQITKVENNSSIVNETNNTFYNPATGATVPITNWSYDYSDRSYKVTLESGDTVTITYGDENIVIKEGDTVYNIYYLIDGSGSENPPCAHEWAETSTTPATCTMPGSKLSACSKCQKTKKEALPALGHDWQVKKTVTTEYDDTGQLTQEGYTIFECSRCHEQFKSTDGAAPPGGGGSATDPGGEDKETIWDKLGNFIGSLGGGLVGLIEAVLGKLLDALTALAEKMMEKLKVVVETILSIFDELPLIFGGFLDFLAALFPFLPPELMTILTFGILAVVFIGIIKAVRR